MKKIILSIALFAGIAVSAAAQDFLLSEQWFSRLNRNPAATGNSDKIQLFYLNRQQWVGFKDAPSTNILNAHAFFESISSGVGLTFYYDTEGVGDQMLNAKAAYSYQLPLAEDMLLSFGVSAGVLNKSFDPEKLTYNDNGNRPLVDEDNSTKLDMDLGVEFSMPMFMAGFSVNHLLDNRDDVKNTTAARQFTGYARGNIALCSDFDLAPGVVYNNYSSNLPGFFEVNATAFYKKLYWLGLGTRFNSGFEFATLNAMVGFEWNFLRIGYGYDLSLDNLGELAKSTHEIMLSVKFGNLDKKKTTQRYVRFME
ncbi:MAG: PorP/SprF family type IX secretion system membrane protein [Prevotellaceae bacterium]|jgi:type IX secretion system PorP/SprF family membrane protein|nr:PorP/SprF family type IX secretion system membrane protein [Prevotellaceae bacterium]